MGQHQLNAILKNGGAIKPKKEDQGEQEDCIQCFFRKKAREGDGSFAIAYALMALVESQYAIAMETEGVAKSIEAMAA